MTEYYIFVLISAVKLSYLDQHKFLVAKLIQKTLPTLSVLTIAIHTQQDHAIIWAKNQKSSGVGTFPEGELGTAVQLEREGA